jgi:hypothetical protein
LSSRRANKQAREHLASRRKEEEEEEEEEEKKKTRKKNRKDMSSTMRIGKGRKAEKRNLLVDPRFFLLLSLSLYRPTAFTVDRIVHRTHQ